MAARPWAPSDLRTSRGREKALMLRMEVFIKELDNSRFYHHFRRSIRSSSIFEHVRKVLGAHSKMQMVIYGLGRFELSHKSALQLSLAILIQRDFKWIGNIEVFDPVLSVTECRVLEAIGCSVLCFNENAMRKVLEPTLFFMPYCEFRLLNNLLPVNWSPGLLSKVVIFGTSLRQYMTAYLTRIKPILAADKFANEFIMKTRNPRISFANNFSWIFFDLEQQFMNNLPYLRHDILTRKKIDLHVYFRTEIILKEKINKYMDYLESSQFYHNLKHNLQVPPISQHLDMVRVGSESKMKLVICDIGSIEKSNFARSRLSLSLLLKKHFKWIGDIQVFEAFLSATERRVFKAFGCNILSLDGYRRSWQALKPTMFFVADYSTMLCNHLLKANWNSSQLSNIVLLGNSLNNEEEKIDSHMDLEYSMRYNEAAESFTKCFRIEAFCHDFYNAFRHLTWQFFSPVMEAELQFMHKFLEKGCYISLLP